MTVPDQLSNKALWKPASFVGGLWVDTDAPSWVDVMNPATGGTVGRIPNYGAAMANAAVDAASLAFRGPWRCWHGRQRGIALAKWAKLMHANTDDLGLLITAESGKPLPEAKSEVGYAATFVEWFAGEAERVYGDVIQQPRDGARTLVVKQPVGVVAIVTPWNMPAGMVTRSVATALAAGCTVVLKPADLTPFTAIALCVLAHEAGIPAGVLNLVTGDAPPIGDALTANDAVRKICFTGSTRVGKLLYRQSADTMKKLSLELGGNAPFIVFDDADLDNAIDALMVTKFRNAGQACVCTNRVFVQRRVHDTFVAKVEARLRATFVVGNGMTPGVTMGPLITAAAADNIRAKIDDAVAKGARLSQPVKASHEPFATRNFVKPTVLTGVTDAMRIANEEIFGPVVPILVFDDEAEVLKRANAVNVGLASYVFTEDYRRQWRMLEGLEFGMVGVNEGGLSSTYAPFGGVKHSGLGRDGSKYGIENFVEAKYVLIGGKL